MFDCMVLDGPVIIHSLPSSGVTTFNKYMLNKRLCRVSLYFYL